MKLEKFEKLEKLANSEPAKKTFSLIEEFKNFAFKGNVVDLAIGVIIGSAFAKVVDSLVKNVLMPFIGLLLPGEQGYLGWKLELGQKEVPYGLFLGDLVQFLLVSLALFIFVVKFLGWIVRFRKEETPPPPTRQEELLTEIRDLLKQNQSAATSPPRPPLDSPRPTVNNT